MEGTIDEARRMIAQYLSGKIFDSTDSRGKSDGSPFHRFITENLEIDILKDGHRRYKYGGYSSQSAHNALEKILDCKSAYKSGQKHLPLVYFETCLLNHLRDQKELKNVDIPDDIFRDTYDPKRRARFASPRYLRDDKADHAEYLCRRFLDKCAVRPRQEMGLRDSDNSGLIAMVVLEDFHADGRNYGKITYTDLFDANVESPGSIEIDDRSFEVHRVCPEAKPTISNASIGRDVRERYTGPSRKDRKFEHSILALQQRVMLDLISLSAGVLYKKVKAVDEVLEEKFNSGSLFRTVFDLEKGAIFVYQVDHGRFWVFSFCPVQSKVQRSEKVLKEDIIDYYEERVGEVGRLSGR